jgi:hypothetical protein
MEWAGDLDRNQMVYSEYIRYVEYPVWSIANSYQTSFFHVSDGYTDTTLSTTK